MKASDISVLLGAHNIGQTNETGRVVFSADAIYIHDEWNTKKLEFNNDVALIRLSETVTFNQNIQPVCLPSTETLNQSNGTVVGWGHYDDKKIISDYPREVDVPILDDFDCLKNNIFLAAIFDRKTMFCAGRENVALCPGDSGSGFYVENDGIFYVRGLVSSGAGKTCSSTIYVLYSDVVKNMEFIKQVMNSLTVGIKSLV